MNNFPTATDADWNAERARLERFARRHGLTDDQAEELAQAALVALLTAEWRQQCPASLTVAVGWRINTAKRFSVWALSPSDRRQARPSVPAPVREIAAAWTDPARMAEAGEELAARHPRLAARLRQEGTTPAAAALRAAGWLQIDQDDAARVSPSVPTSGPGYTPPLQGCPGLATATDPNPASRERARLRCVNDWRRVAGLPPLAE